MKTRIALADYFVKLYQKSRDPNYVVTCTPYYLLGAFEKLRKVSIILIMSVCLSVRNEQLGSHSTDFHEILYLSIFRKFLSKYKFINILHE
jgi:hypothetical protein